VETRIGPADSAAVLPRAAREREHRVFLRTLDCLPLNLLYFDLHGERLHSNSSARRLLRELTDPQQLLDAVGEFADTLGEAAQVGGQTEWKAREHSLSVGRFLLRAGYVAIPLFGGQGFILVTIALQQAGLSSSELQAAHGLTRQQARIAMLLAAGLSNREIAEQLSISPHTVRRHTEQVMSKLCVRSRAQVANLLLNAAPNRTSPSPDRDRPQLSR
jgi:DNA-binding CsgD family transcriptional regulator